MDDIDLDIVRWMHPGGVWSPWGGDPRIRVAEVAARVGLDRTAVWARLRKWRRVGFWNGFYAHVNLRIFGVGMVLATFDVTDSAEGWDLLDRVGEIEGVLGANLRFGDSLVERDVEYVAVTVVADTPSKIRRRMHNLLGLSPTGVVGGPANIESPPCSRELTELDWRILAAVVANPNAPAFRLADLVGVSFKTFDRHLSALIDDQVVTWVPKFDWSKLGCITLVFYCLDAQDIEVARSALGESVPHSIPISAASFAGVAPGCESFRCFGFIVPSQSPHAAQTLVRDLSQLPGVKLVRQELWGPSRGFPSWIKQRIAEHLASPGDLGYASFANAQGQQHGVVGSPVREEGLGLTRP
jgi:DNA-binding Lrp family transcriptional regulator